MNAVGLIRADEEALGQAELERIGRRDALEDVVGKERVGAVGRLRPNLLVIIERNDARRRLILERRQRIDERLASRRKKGGPLLEKTKHKNAT